VAVHEVERIEIADWKHIVIDGAVEEHLINIDVFCDESPFLVCDIGRVIDSERNRFTLKFYAEVDISLLLWKESDIFLVWNPNVPEKMVLFKHEAFTQSVDWFLAEFFLRNEDLEVIEFRVFELEVVGVVDT